MEVQLYVYDLSRGLARSMSVAFLGTQIDAVYHTSIVLQGIEYVYDGGIQAVRPGKTHLGVPMQTLNLGKTELPMDVVQDYLESLRPIYTLEAYDLWRHNCNNFSNDFATFLLGKGIPSHITNLPEKVLNSPFGQMMRPQIDDVVRNNRNRRAGLLGLAENAAVQARNVPPTTQQRAETVTTAANLQELATILASAQSSCAIIFFTSEACPPCKTLYPLYNELAADAAHKCAFIKVDVGKSQEIGLKYSIRATPTFVALLEGKEESRWSGADQSTLRGNAKMLIEMAWPAHPHESLRLPTLRSAAAHAVIYQRVPPLDKLVAKIGDKGTLPAVQGVRNFIAASHAQGPAESTLPDLDAFSRFLRSAIETVQTQNMFAVFDLLRVAMVDPRFSGYYAEEKDHRTIASLLTFVNDLEVCPYALRLVALQTACNLFSSPLYAHHILSCELLRTPIVRLITSSLLDEKHHSVRVAAASLVLNIASANAKIRVEEHREIFPASDMVELAASLLETIASEDASAEAFQGLLLALGQLVYCAPIGSELLDLLKAMDAHGTVLAKKETFLKEGLIDEIGKELLGSI